MRSVTAAVGQDLSINAPEWGLFMQVEFDVKIDAGALFDYMINRAYSHAAGVMEAALGAVLLIFFGRTGNFVYLAAGLIVFAALPVFLYLKAKRQEKEPDYSSSLHYTLTEDGVEVVRAGGREFWKWEEMERAVSTTKSVILYTHGSGVCIFPRGELKDNLIPAVEMISTHMLPKKVNIRM